MRHILARIHVSRDAAGRVTRYYGANQDITDQKRAEEALVRKTAFLEALVHSSCDGILVVDDQRRKVFQNRRYIELRKLPQEIADEKDDKNQLQYLATTAKNPEQFIEKIDYLYSHPYETSLDEIETTDGTILERYSAPVVKDGKYYGRIWTFHDVTQPQARRGRAALGNDVSSDPPQFVPGRPPGPGPPEAEGHRKPEDDRYVENPRGRSRR